MGGVISQKKRLYRLKCRIIERLEAEGHEVFHITSDPLFHLIAIREHEIRLIYISEAEPDPALIGLVRSARRRATKEIWYRGEKNRLTVLKI